MTRETFKCITGICAPFLQKEDTRPRFKQAIPLPKRVAVGLYWLANGGSQKTAGVPFGVSRSASREIITDFVDGLFELRNHFIKFPVTEEDYIKVIKSFERKTLLPNAVGAIDGTHVEIAKPIVSAVDYFSPYTPYTSTQCSRV